MNPFSPVILEDTESRIIESNIVDQAYQISVALPGSYSGDDAQENKYPAIFVLDGNWCFGSVIENARVMAYCGAFPEVIVFGIGYPAGQSQNDTLNKIRGPRSRDCTPVKDEEWEAETKEQMGLDFIETGGSEDFFRFIGEELLPFVESAYRVDSSQKVLAGVSFGGLSVLHALFQDPALFQGYIAASPSLWFGDGAMFEIEEEYASNHDDLRAKLYLSIGQEEENVNSRMVSNLFRFLALLRSHEFDGVTLRSQVFEGLNHCDAGGPGLQLGLKWFFS